MLHVVILLVTEKQGTVTVVLLLLLVLALWLEYVLCFNAPLVPTRIALAERREIPVTGTLGVPLHGDPCLLLLLLVRRRRRLGPLETTVVQERDDGKEGR
jgi:hypothetical protein